jgi:hypothetical protein
VAVKKVLASHLQTRDPGQTHFASFFASARGDSNKSDVILEPKEASFLTAPTRWALFAACIEVSGKHAEWASTSNRFWLTRQGIFPGRPPLSPTTTFNAKHLT